MIESKELRIGNWVEGLLPDDRDMIPCEFQADAKTMYALSTEEYVCEACIIDPIPLTEEWLIKFGFKLMVETEYTLDTFELNGVQLWNKKRDFTELRYNTCGIDVKHVHSLQNLYFALTGEELTIKEDVAYFRNDTEKDLHLPEDNNRLTEIKE
jgi:hypothetical protein